ncbi:MAG TPA: dTDP-4-dehydrorhamnose reductase [Streptosporangiaceae bacterium]|nr:dTDP-4-dehydrorhamnose reductase [Streptosporangiaceae bacterium]
MRWLVTGAAGMLAREVINRLEAERDPATWLLALDRAALDITDQTAVDAAVKRHRPDVVVNCAAYTAVDSAEVHEDEALRVNGEGPAYLAEACAARRSRLIHISTDYVFRGDTHVPYLEHDSPAPGTAYGRTKLAGECAVVGHMRDSAVIVRTAWLYASHSRNFVQAMAARAQRGEEVAVVEDQVGSPTWAADVAERIVVLGRLPDAGGIFHAANSGEATWHELAREVFSLSGADPDLVHPIRTRSLTSPTPRPAYTVLGNSHWPRVGLEPLRDWRSALLQALIQRSASGGRISERRSPRVPAPSRRKP